MTPSARDYDGALLVGPPTHTTAAAAAAAATLAVSVTAAGAAALFATCSSTARSTLSCRYVRRSSASPGSAYHSKVGTQTSTKPSARMSRFRSRCSPSGFVLSLLQSKRGERHAWFCDELPFGGGMTEGVRRHRAPHSSHTPAVGERSIHLNRWRDPRDP